MNNKVINGRLNINSAIYAVLVLVIFCTCNQAFASNRYRYHPDLPDPHNQYFPTGQEACYYYIDWYTSTYPNNPLITFSSYEEVGRPGRCFVFNSDSQTISVRNIDFSVAPDCEEDDNEVIGFNPLIGECESLATRPKSLGGPEESCSLNHTKKPIHIATGNKYYKEEDYIGGARTFSAIRNYNSQRRIANAMGAGWGMSWLSYRITNITTQKLYLNRPNGKMYPFKLVNGSWEADADVTGTLEQLSDTSNNIMGWRYTTDDGDIETYNAKGDLISFLNRTGWAWTINTTDISTVVTDPLNKQLVLTYDNNRIIKLTNLAGGTYAYTYSSDGNNNLKTVTYPDGQVKTYHYGEAANVSASPEAGVSYANSLTGITDENGDRYATYRYDAQGRAYDEELAPDLGASSGQAIEHNNLVYNVDGSGNPTSTVVTDPRGTQHTYNFTTILGVVKSTGTDQPAGAGCAASGSNITYDANGNISTKTDFNGNQTTYAYDMSRNLETSRTEGLTTTGSATPETRTITTTWHPTWRLPLVVSEYAGASASGTPLKTTTTDYDDKGNITSVSVNDPVNNISRTVTTAYTYSSAVPGLMLSKVVDGPRTDVNDITTYTYYPHDATCTPSTATPIIDPITNTSPENLGCRGQLQSVTNAANQTTTYDRYNHHGQVEQMTDPNGLVTENTYDLRQRITSRTVGSELTSLQYDAVGQLTQLTMPDGSQLSYTYDAAHRLTDIADNLGNKIHYTLDAQGNRINEDMTDPANQLTKTLSRSYDALNRLQQVVGIE